MVHHIPEPDESKDDRFTKTVFGVVTLLLASGVLGLWHMSTNLSKLEERVEGWTKFGNERIDYATKRIDEISRDQREYDARVNVIEGYIRNNVAEKKL